VEVDDQIFFFKSTERIGYERALKEAREFLTIAHLGEALRTSRLYGIVQDENNPLIGLLFHYEIRAKLKTGPEACVGPPGFNFSEAALISIRD
jgi:hypothetical protein